MKPPPSLQLILATRIKRGLTPLFALLPFTTATAQVSQPEISYPTPSLSAIKVSDPLPEDLVPVKSGGEVPAIAYGGVDTFAGSGTAGSTNATGTAARFSGPWGISSDAHGNFYVADFIGKRIRKVTPAGVVSLIDEFGSFEPIATAVDPATGHLYCAIATHRILRYVNKNSANYPAEEPVYGPETNFPDATIVYAGSSTSGTTNATGTSARFNSPHTLAVHDGFLYVADKGNNRIRRINLSTAAVETVIFTGGTLNDPEGIAIRQDGAIYVANTGGNDLIQKIQDGEITTFAGNGDGYANGLIPFVKFDNPRGLLFDAHGNLLVAEGNNNAIRRISSDGLVTTLAGSTAGGYNASRGYQDDIGNAARFDSPRGMAVGADGLVYVTDHVNHRIRRLCLTGYEIEPALPAGLMLDAATGVISGTATELTPEGGELFPDYSNTFQNGAGNATLHGAAEVTYLGKVQLTPNTANSSGGITVPASNRNPQEMEVSFVLETTKASGGGQGLSYNFAEGLSGGNTDFPYAENGIGSGLSLVLDPLGETGGGVKGVRLLYGNKVFQPGSTPGANGVLAYSPSIDWAGKSSTVTLTIDQRFHATVSLDGEALFSNIPLPADYVTTDKSQWTHAILARTDTSTDEFIIDDLIIRQSLEGAAQYRVTARNAAGSGTAMVSINIKEAPAIAFNLQALLVEDQENAIFSPLGRDWNSLPTFATGSEYVRALAGDVNLQKLIGIRATTLNFNQYTLHVYDPETTSWKTVNGTNGSPLMANWQDVACSADGSVLVAVSRAGSTTNSSSNTDIPGIIAWSTDGGDTWQSRLIASSGLWSAGGIAISADGNTIYVAAMVLNSNSSISNLSPGGLHFSRDRGQTWSVVYPAGTPYPVFSVSCDASGQFLALNAVGNVNGQSQYDRLLISKNGGASWSDMTPSLGIQITGLRVMVTAEGQTLYLSPRASGSVYISNDQALSWRNTYPGTNTPDFADSALRFAANADGMRLAQFNSYSNFVMSNDAGLSFNAYPFESGGPSQVFDLISSYTGKSLAIGYQNKVYISQGSGIELTHGKGDSQEVSLTLASPGGFLRVTPQEGVTISGNGTDNLVLTGPLGLINAILESLTYQGGADFTGGAAFTFTASTSGVSNTQASELTIEGAAQPDMAAQPSSSSITETTATLGGSVLGNGGSALTRRGVVISPTETNASPVRGGNGVIDLSASGTSLGAFTVKATELAPGTSYSFRAYAMNANGPQYSALGTFTTAGGTPPDSPAASWRKQYFGTAENTGNAADLATPDGDGIANLIKYALGLTPGQNSSHLLPRPSISMNGDQRYLSIQLTRIPARNDVTIAVEAISELGGEWTSIATSENGTAFQGTANITETDHGDGTVGCEIRDTVEIGQAPKRFMRVRVVVE